MHVICNYEYLGSFLVLSANDEIRKDTYTFSVFLPALLACDNFRCGVHGLRLFLPTRRRICTFVPIINKKLSIYVIIFVDIILC